MSGSANGARVSSSDAPSESLESVRAIVMTTPHPGIKNNSTHDTTTMTFACVFACMSQGACFCSEWPLGNPTAKPAPALARCEMRESCGSSVRHSESGSTHAVSCTVTTLSPSFGTAERSDGLELASRSFDATGSSDPGDFVSRRMVCSPSPFSPFSPSPFCKPTGGVGRRVGAATAPGGARASGSCLWLHARRDTRDEGGGSKMLC